MDDIIDAIVIFAAATSSDLETYANLMATAASLKTELALSNKTIISAIRDNDHLERLLGQIRIDGRKSKKNGNRWSPTWH